MKLIPTFILFLPLSFLFAQNITSENALTNLLKLDLGLRGVGVSFEPRLGKRMTVDLSTGLGGGYNISSNSFEYKWNFLDPAIFIIVNPKFYYNLKNRIGKGKDVSRNSGNYIGAVI